MPKIDAAGVLGVRLAGKRRKRTPLALVPEQRLEYRLNVVRAAEDSFDARPAAAEPQHRQIADGRVARGLAVDDDRRARLEERLADEQLPAARELADEEVDRYVSSSAT